MSKPRYHWWSYAKAIVSIYPELVEKYNDLHTVSITSKWDAMPSGSGISNPTENAALRELPPARQRELDAVNRAIELTKLMKTGDEQIKLIDLVFWKKSHNIAGAAMILYVSEITAKRWHADFIRRVGFCYGLEDGDPYPEGKRLKGKKQGKTLTNPNICRT